MKITLAKSSSLPPGRVLCTVVLLGIGLSLVHEVQPMIHANPPPAAEGQAEGKHTERPFVVEYYYKAKWGHADEFIRLFKKNHYQVLKKQVDSGRMLRVSAVKPRYHATEDGRWDYRVTIVFKNVEAAFAPHSEEEAIKKELFLTKRRSAQRKNAGSRSFRPTGTCRSMTSSSKTERDAAPLRLHATLADPRYDASRWRALKGPGQARA